MSGMESKRFHLDDYSDSNKLCKNPHKGWYLHYYSNSLHNYGGFLEESDYLHDFPGLDHLYLRVAWSYLEPEEGKYNWRVFDDIIEKWLPHGYRFAFRVTCKETAPDQVFATPKWVQEAGAKGLFVPQPSIYNAETGWLLWEPDYGDPVFLHKLENFHQAFAKRYDDKSWVEYVDIGSYGEWGEGHTWFGSRRKWPVDVLKKHTDIHLKYYKNSFIMANDDMINDRIPDEGSGTELLNYFAEQGLGIRDDAPGKQTWMFDRFWRTRPVNAESEHYHILKKNSPDWKEGRLQYIHYLKEMIGYMHATYVGFHGDAREWLADNSDIAEAYYNRIGYWYFLQAAECSVRMERGASGVVKLSWINRGVAPAYYPYKLAIRLSKSDENGCSFTQIVDDSGNRNWMPDERCEETYVVHIPQETSPGAYRLQVSLFEQRDGRIVPIELALQDRIKDHDDYYTIAETYIV